MSIVFSNSGLIDIRAISTFGASSKVGESPIGYFGTGLKYAIAIILREGGTITLYRSKKKFEFTAKRTKIRNDHFQIVNMNGDPLGFTTELGKNWDLSQAFRELWCNTIDEGGSVSADDTWAEGAAGATRFVVTGMDEIYENRHTIILERPADYRLPGVEVHDMKSEYIFYRGIRAQKLRHPSIFTYNITSACTLTEDRTLRYFWEPLNAVKSAIVASSDLDFVTQVLEAGDDTYERSLDFGDLQRGPGSTFLSVAHSLRGKAVVNESALKLCREALRKEMDDNGKELVGAPAAQLEKAKEFCKIVGFPVDRHPIIVVDALEDNDEMLAEDGRIFITQALFIKGTRALIKKLIRGVMVLDGDTAETTLMNHLITAGIKISGEELG